MKQYNEVNKIVKTEQMHILKIVKPLIPIDYYRTCQTKQTSREVINMLLSQILAITIHGKIYKGLAKTINLKFISNVE